MADFDFTTRSVRSGLCTDSQHGAVVPPLHLSTNFTFEGLGGKRRYDYTRSGNPTRDLLAEALASLESGHSAVVTSSGMAALALLAQTFARPGDLVLAPHDCYGGTFRLLNALAERGALEVAFIDFGDRQATAAAFARPNARLAIVESPSNPLLRVVDLAEIARLARARGVLCAADNTFLSPALQRPLELGADLVVHSTTKYLNGHGDVVGGAVVARSAELGERLAWWANCLGVTGSPFDSYLTLRGVRTLSARMRAHLENAEAVVEVLIAHPAVARVHYPGLSSHPGHEIAKRQQSGFGGIVSFELAFDPARDDGEGRVAEFVRTLRHFSLAESLGGVESLVAHPASMTHASMTPEARARAGIGDTLLRLSVGIESARDLAEDLRHALDRAWIFGGRRTESALRVAY